MSLCKHKDIFGTPKEGFHASRIGPYAAGDLLGTIILALLLTMFTGKACEKRTQITDFVAWFLLLVIIGEILHVAFCVETQGITELKLLSSMPI